MWTTCRLSVVVVVVALVLCTELQFEAAAGVFVLILVWVPAEGRGNKPEASTRSDNTTASHVYKHHERCDNILVKMNVIMHSTHHKT
jgi:hypothetical protein